MVAFNKYCHILAFSLVFSLFLPDATPIRDVAREKIRPRLTSSGRFYCSKSTPFGVHSLLLRIPSICARRCSDVTEKIVLVGRVRTLIICLYG